MRKKFKILPISILSLYILFFSALYIFDNSSNGAIHIPNLKVLSGEFTVNGDVYAELPDRIETSGVVTIKKNMTSINKQDYLLIRASLQEIRVYDGNTLLYEKTFNNKNHPYASLWHIIEIKEVEDLTIEIYSPFEQMNGLINPIYHGSISEINVFMFDNYRFIFITGLFVLIIGLLITVLSFVYRESTKSHYLYLGLFLVMISFWILSESKVLQFIINSPDLVGSLSYVTLPLLSIPILYFFKLTTLKRYDNWLYGATGGLIALLVIILQLTGLKSYFETVVVSHIFNMVVSIVIMVLLTKETFKYKNADAARALKMLSIFLPFALAEYIYFLFGRFRLTSLFLVTGVVFISIIILVDYLRSISKYNKSRHETTALEKLAYTDYLTGANNRLSFEQKLESALLDPQTFVVLFYFDVDHLKEINDTFGHNEGDRIIKKSYEIISNVFEEVNCFRVGGDEFACVKTNLSEQQIKALTDSFKQALSVCQLDENCNISISMGYTTSKEAKTIYEIIKMADEQMYKQKRRNHNESITAKIS